jgi:membrane-bound lytic murein transglycosylase D
MKIVFLRYLLFLTIFLPISCSTVKPPVVNDTVKLIPAPYYETNVVLKKDDATNIVSLINQDKDNIPVQGLISTAGPEKADAYVENTAIEKSVIGKEDSFSVAAETENGDSIVKDEDLLDTALESCNTAQELWSQSNPEKAIEALDEAYQLLLKIDTESHPELVRQTEDLRFMISKRILEIYTSRFTTVNGNHKEIPLTMNANVEREIKSFQGYEREFFTEGVKRSGRYREAMITALKEAGMPEELSWLPLVESWFKVAALSPARALGLWQFIPSTGYRYGLKRDNWIDERLHPEKATKAAISYLKDLHQMFGDWTTVLAAYNCGEGNILRVIRQQKINYLDNFWDLYGRLPNETARYVPRFLATLHIMQDPAKYGFSFDNLESPPLYESISIEKQVQLKTLADVMGVTFEGLYALNPELRRQATPPAQYSLNVPVGTGNMLLSKLETLPSWTPQKNEYNDHTFYTVKRGDTLYRIAAKYRTSIDAIIKANKISRKRTLNIGQKLRIPLGRGSDMLSAADDATSDKKYRAGKGETLKTIAKKFNTNTAQLKRINNLTSSLLYEGQILQITK